VRALNNIVVKQTGRLFTNRKDGPSIFIEGNQGMILPYACPLHMEVSRIMSTYGKWKGLDFHCVVIQAFERTERS
jgi:hypothetical protein